MNRREPLILVDSPELVSSGLWPDRHVAQTPLWELVQNAQFAGGKVRRRLSNQLIFDAGANPVRGLGQLQASDGVRWIWAASGGRIVRWYGPPLEEIAAALTFQRDATATQEPTYFDFTPWGNWMLVNSADNGIRRYDPAGPTFAVLPGAPDDAVAFFKKRNQLLAIGYGVNRRLVGFSDADNIEDWVSTATNLAGEIPLEEADTPIRAGCHFGPSVAVLTENQLFEVRWIGAPFYYGQQKLLDGVGAVGKQAVCNDGRLIYGFSVNGAWRSDGNSYTYSDEVILRDYLQENINWAQAAKITVRKNDVSGCIEFSFPVRGNVDCNEAWSFDPRYGGWGPVPAFETMAPRSLLRKNIQGMVDGDVELIEDDDNGAGDLLLETKAMLAQRDNNALHVGALMDEFEIFMHKASKVEFQYGVAEFPDGPWSWTSPEELKEKQVTYRPLVRITGTYHKLRFQNIKGTTDWQFDLQGFAVFGIADGQKREKA